MSDSHEGHQSESERPGHLRGGALNLLREQPVHLLLADIVMREMDGYELIRRVRAAGHQVPAIAVTAFARSEERRHALECGYAAYLAKPSLGAQLARTIREIIPAVDDATAAI